MPVDDFFFLDNKTEKAIFLQMDKVKRMLNGYIEDRTKFEKEAENVFDKGKGVFVATRTQEQMEVMRIQQDRKRIKKIKASQQAKQKRRG